MISTFEAFKVVSFTYQKKKVVSFIFEYFIGRNFTQKKIS